MFWDRRLWAGLLCALFMSSTLLVPAYAAKVSSLKNDKSAIDSQIKSQEAKLKEKKKEKADIFDQLQDINSSIEEADKKIEDIHNKKAETEKAIAATEKELKEAEARLEERTEIFGTRLKEIYKQGDVDYLEVLMEATSFRDFLVRYHLLEKIAEQDMDLLEEIENEHNVIVEKQAKLETDKKELAALEQEAQESIQVLEQKKGEKKKIMASLETEKAAIEKGLAELEKASNAVAAQIRAAQSRPTAYSGKSSGQFLWPVSGPITSDFGWRVHPVLGTRRLHTGIDIGVGSGTPIHAADAGAVISAGWMGAYGNAVVIDHGGGLSTLYGHMSSIGVRAGQTVSAGQVIGKVGSTGWSTGPHLHFEVRRNGDPVNPMGYL